MDQSRDDIDWSLTTWEGSRRAQLRRALAMTVRELSSANINAMLTLGLMIGQATAGANEYS